jgi:hypothetical protein
MRFNRTITMAVAAAAFSVPLTVSAPRQAEAFWVAIPIAAAAMMGAMSTGALLGGAAAPVADCQSKGYANSRSGSTYDPRTGRFNGFTTQCYN